jgi:hypothetical protein
MRAFAAWPVTLHPLISAIRFGGDRGRAPAYQAWPYAVALVPRDETAGRVTYVQADGTIKSRTRRL